MKTRIILTRALIICFAVVPVALFAQTPQSPRGPAELEMLRQRTGPWLGLELSEVTPAKVSALKLPGDYGAIVTKVEPASPAAQAGLKENDVILEFGGMRVWSAAQLAHLVSETPAGRVVELVVSRDGRRMHFSAKLAARPSAASILGFNFRMPEIRIPPIHVPAGSFNFRFPGMGGRLGIEAEDLTPQLAGYFKVTQGKGVLVAEVEEGSPAAKAGLKAGDCIIRVNGTEVDSLSSLRRALGPNANHELSLTIVRDGHEQSVQVNLEPAWTPNPQQMVIAGPVPATVLGAPR
jgi:serine protease Do